ncbi:PDZ domain-containing protein [Virgibacillus halodenitrificans]|uniref:PDZ domain-containing protein n=1 Tax=Virgibacillus halodenitrificans TaxID=1482 RepID=UPI000AE51A7D
MLFPLLIGFEQAVLGNAPANAARRLAKQVILLGVFILVLAVGSVFQSWFTLAAVVLSILGRELINYRFRTADRLSPSFFQRSKAGLKVLAIIPETPAERLEILPGEVITKVNGFRVSGIEEFYYSLQKSGAFFKLEIIDFNGENRFVQGALYEGDHHELGVVFAADPYRKKRLLSN